MNPYKEGSLFVHCTNEEMNDFFSFRDASKLLDTKSDLCCVPYSKSLEAILMKLDVVVNTTMQYNDKYFMISFNDILAVASWMDEKRYTM